MARVATKGTTPKISMKKPFITPVRMPMHRHRMMHSQMGKPMISRLTTMMPDSAIDAPALRSLPPQTRQKDSPQPMMV